jgi:hypothetical protein
LGMDTGVPLKVKLATGLVASKLVIAGLVA